MDYNKILVSLAVILRMPSKTYSPGDMCICIFVYSSSTPLHSTLSYSALLRSTPLQSTSRWCAALHHALLRSPLLPYCARLSSAQLTLVHWFFHCVLVHTLELESTFLKIHMQKPKYANPRNLKIQTYDISRDTTTQFPEIQHPPLPTPSPNNKSNTQSAEFASFAVACFLCFHFYSFAISRMVTTVYGEGRLRYSFDAAREHSWTPEEKLCTQ